MTSQGREQIKKLIKEEKISEAAELATADAAKGSGKEGEVIAKLNKADVCFAKGQPDDGLKAARDAWPIAKELASNKALQADVLVTMVAGLSMKGNASDVLRAATTSMANVEAAGKDDLKALLLHYTAAAHLRVGDANDAMDVEKKAMAIYEKLGDKTGVATSKTTIAKAMKSLGQVEEALAMAKESCAAFRAEGRAAGVAANLDTISACLVMQGIPKASLAEAEEQLDLFKKAKPPQKSVIMLMEKVMEISKDIGQKLEACVTMDEIIKTIKETGDKVAEANKILEAALMHNDMMHYEDALRLAKEAQALFDMMGDTPHIEDCKRLQTEIFVKRGEHTKAPHRAEALGALKSFVRAVEQREQEEMKKYEIEMDKSSAAIKDTEMSNALEALFERDPAALAYLEKSGWNLDSFKTPSTITYYPHKGFYLNSVAGGMNFGPQFRSVHPMKIDKQPNPKACSVNQLPETESWQGVLLYRHGIIDGGIQAQGSFGMPPY